MSQEIFKALGLSDVNYGAYLGNGEWSKTTDAGVIEPKNPSTGEVLAKVHASSAEDYETIVKRAQESFDVWRNTPAPVRGEAVRLVGEALRKYKDPLRSLVAGEMGESKPGGDGEVRGTSERAHVAVGT